MQICCTTAVERKTCPAKSVGLVRYPTTLAPVGVSGYLPVITQCADNAHNTSLSLEVSCFSGGRWSGKTPQCECDSGYRAVTVNRKEICQSIGNRKLSSSNTSVPMQQWISNCLKLEYMHIAFCNNSLTYS